MGNNQTEVKTMLLRLVDFLKMKRCTAFFTSLTAAGENMEISDVYISSLIDTWLLLRDIEIGGERNRGLYVLKSRGMEHSNQIPAARPDYRVNRLQGVGIDLAPERSLHTHRANHIDLLPLTAGLDHRGLTF